MKGGEQQDTEVKVFFLILLAGRKKKKSSDPNKMFYICLYIHSPLPPSMVVLLILCSPYFWSFPSKVQVSALSEPYFHQLRRGRDGVIVKVSSANESDGRFPNQFSLWSVEDMILRTSLLN